MLNDNIRIGDNVGSSSQEFDKNPNELDHHQDGFKELGRKRKELLSNELNESIFFIS